jgi:hypothetical protein
VERLQQLDFGQSIQYVKGKENVGCKEKIFLVKHEQGCMKICRKLFYVSNN